jgi:hypothetical protein
MFQVIYEYKQPWPEEGTLRVEAQFSSEIKVSPTLARRRANGFLGTEVTMMVLAGQPVLVVGDRPIWRIPACLHLPGLGEVATIGSVDVDALTGQVIKPADDQITAIRDRANALAARLDLPLSYSQT